MDTEVAVKKSGNGQKPSVGLDALPPVKEVLSPQLHNLSKDANFIAPGNLDKDYLPLNKILDDRGKAELSILLGNVREGKRLLDSKERQRLQSTDELNRQIDEINTAAAEFRTKYKEELDRVVEPIRQKIDQMIEEINLQRTRVAEAAGKLAPKEVEDREKMIEQKRQSLSLHQVWIDIISFNKKEMLIRIAIGLILGLSIGLMMESINLHRILSPITILFAAIGCVVVTLAGLAARMMGNELAVRTRLLMKVSGKIAQIMLWLIFCAVVVVSLAYFVTYAVSDIVVTMEGVFKSIMDNKLFTASGANGDLPRSVMVFACMLFVIPYLLIESVIGWNEGMNDCNEDEASASLCTDEEADKKTPEAIQKAATREKNEEALRDEESKLNAMNGQLNLLREEEKRRRELVPVPRYYPAIASLPGGILTYAECDEIHLTLDTIIKILPAFEAPIRQELSNLEVNYKNAVRALQSFVDKELKRRAPIMTEPARPGWLQRARVKVWNRV